MRELESGSAPGRASSYLRRIAGGWTEAALALPREWPLDVVLNGQELVTLLCTPTRLNALVLGFLFLEGIVDGVDEVAMIRVCPDETRCEVLVPAPRREADGRRTITSGCGGGTTLGPAPGLPPVRSEARFSPTQIAGMMKALLQSARGYAETGGIHTSALSDGEQLLVAADDIGRHNTVDKIAGECLIRGLSARDRLLLTTGRVSSEMLLKAVRLGVPAIASRTSPTDLAVRLAWELGVTLVGYVRGDAFNVYALPDRVTRD